MEMIRTEGLTKNYGKIPAVENLSFGVEKGEIFGLLGRNGAGKTTTVRILCSLISLTEGEAWISGYDVRNKEDTLKIRKMIGLVPENVGLYEELSAYQNLDFYGKLFDMPEKERRESILKHIDMLGLRDAQDRAVATYSKGMKQKVAVARALIHDPEILFLDEPTANLDPESAKTVRDLILDSKRSGKTVFLNTHNLDEAQRICDRIAILNTRLMAIGTPEQLRERVGGRKTVIQLEKVTPAITAALESAYSDRLAVEGNSLQIQVTEPDRENTEIIKIIVGAGGLIKSVNVIGSTLEDAYMQLVKGEDE